MAQRTCIATRVPEKKAKDMHREFLTREAEFERQMMKFFITNIRKRKYT
jgi:hypothetical protein